MTVAFDLSTARIDRPPSNTTTHVTFFDSRSAGGRRFALFDMKEGHSLLQGGHRFAFTLNGQIDLQAGFDPNEVRRWRFGFIQFAAYKQLRLLYLGRTQADGHVEIDLGRVIGSRFILDKLPAPPMPFIAEPTRDELNGQVAATMGDHPFLSVRHQLRNQKTGHLNTLFRLEYDFHAISTFVGRDPAGAFVSFAHIAWFLSYTSEFQIVAGQVVARAKHGGLRFSPVTLGKHPNVPADPHPPIFNDVATRALQTAFQPGDQARFDGLFYPPSTPDNFIFDLTPVATK